MAWEDVRDSVGHALSDAVSGEGEMVTKWAAVIEVVDSDGKRSAYAIAPEDAKPWDTLGLFAFAQQWEQAQLTADEIRGRD